MAARGGRAAAGPRQPLAGGQQRSGQQRPVAVDRPGGAPGGVPRALPIIAIVLAVAGLAVSAYLTYEHFTMATTLACPEGRTLNCQTVTSSEQSKLFGIPVAVLGVAYFVGMLAVVAPPAWHSPRRLLTAARLAGGLGGVGFVLYLVYAELFIIDAICLWCTVVHVLTVVLFAVIALGTAMAEPPERPAPAR